MLELISPEVLYRAALLTAVLYVIFAWALYVIAQKQQIKNAWLAWIPLVNLYILGKTAGFGLGTIFLLFIPFINIIVGIYAWIATSKRMGYSGWNVLMLFIPILNFYFLYLLAQGEPTILSPIYSKQDFGKVKDLKCPKCSSSIGQDDSFCGECGMKLNLGSTHEKVTFSPVFTGLIFVGVFAVLTYFFYTQFSSGFVFGKNEPAQELDDNSSQQREESSLKKELTPLNYNNETKDKGGIIPPPNLAPSEVSQPSSNGALISLDNAGNRQSQVAVSEDVGDQIEDVLNKYIVSFDNLDIVEPTSPIGEVFSKVDKMPVFPGCDDFPSEEQNDCTNKELQYFIESNIEYPEKAIKNGIEGIVILKIVIDKEGYVRNPDIVTDIGGDCGKEAMRVINLLNIFPKRFLPGKQNNQSVSVEMIVPVLFSI